jgi:small subunit ribosomal protein S16
MLTIRLFRTGKRNQPLFKIVVTDKRRPPRGGRFVEEVGFYNPLKKEKILKAERIKYWISVGAKPSPTIFNLLVSEKIVEGKKIPAHKKKKIKETASASVAAPASQAEKPAETPTEKPKPEESTKPAEEKKEEAPKETKTETKPDENPPAGGPKEKKKEETKPEEEKKNKE